MTRVFTSAVINTHIDKVWMKIRDFNALPNWHPAIANSYIENAQGVTTRLKTRQGMGCGG
ncbi:MAG: hypothetical protein F6K50_23895 [Moorea sp. SIO3I7]|nr:hypothetical protein [Moorena sp. SIO3I7]NEO63736.1 hypothetical protein [Moorena sp. SIO4G2]